MAILNANEMASIIHTELQSLQVKNTPNVRAIRRKYSRSLRKADGRMVLDIARALRENYGYRSVPYELILAHKEAFSLIGEKELLELGRGLNSWWSVDSFARTLSGGAWREGQIGDEVILKWAKSSDKWWRRAALVSTVALNIRSRGGKGDVPRTMRVCQLLVNDHDDMVEKALSWALRELVAHDAESVKDFLTTHERRLGSRVKREVWNKLKTGLKAPKKNHLQKE